MAAGMPLFDWSPAPDTSPAPTPVRFVRAKGDPRDYRAEWLAWVEAHQAAAQAIEDHALDEYRRGQPRIEVNALFASVRRDMRVSLNHNYRAACADWLVEREPRLDALIERRRRKVTR